MNNLSFFRHVEFMHGPAAFNRCVVLSLKVLMATDWHTHCIIFRILASFGYLQLFSWFRGGADL